MMKKIGLKNYFEIPRAPSEIPEGPARPIQLSWTDFFALGSRNSEGAHGILKYFLRQKW